jgi:hypothetical protein
VTSPTIPSGDPAVNAAVIEALIDGIMVKATETYEQTGRVYELALDVLSERVHDAWQDRLTPEVAGVVAALCLHLVEAREAYMHATGARP